ncbi:MAG: hypothetical protein C5B53_03245 [Candidatus Melainabacteria bacterium]|nr:MAG: hypothetical protein C5B53_03245 [Candidatus Melainabacteria bacterium]
MIAGLIGSGKLVKRAIEVNRRSRNELEALALLLQFLRTEIRNRLHERLRNPRAQFQATDQDLDSLICQYQQLQLMYRSIPDRRKQKHREKSS